MKNMNQEASEYLVNFSEEDLARYREKLRLATGEQLPDPYTLKEKWTNNSPGNYMEGCHRVFTRHTQCLHEGVHLSLQVSRNLQQLCLRPCAKLLLPRNISRVKVLFHQNTSAC